MLTISRLRSLLEYEPTSGTFMWRQTVNNNKAHIGTPAGNSTGEHGYHRICIDGRLYTAHRLAWAWMTGEWPKEIDHINRDRADNRWENLRVCTTAQNHANARLRRDNSTGLKGVSFHQASGRWRATISNRHIGLFDTAEAAHAAYCQAAVATFGEFAFNGEQA